MRKVFDGYKPNPGEWLKYVMRWVQGFAALELEFKIEQIRQQNTVATKQLSGIKETAFGRNEASRLQSV